MLYSISGDESSSSTWLDRLRLSRGISGDDGGEVHLSLEHFLRLNHHCELPEDPPTSGVSDTPPSLMMPSNQELAEGSKERDEGKDGEWYGVMSDVLSELFNFGGTTRSSMNYKKKFPRKQPNPRHCSVEVPYNVPKINEGDPSCLPGVEVFVTTSLNSGIRKPAPTTRERRRRILEPDGVEEEDQGETLAGYSRSEVTVIDTSFEIWKSEKLVFRRKKVWKARDIKSGKSRVISATKKKKKKKKRKCSVSNGEIAEMKISGGIPRNVSALFAPSS